MVDLDENEIVVPAVGAPGTGVGVGVAVVSVDAAIFSAAFLVQAVVNRSDDKMKELKKLRNVAFVI